MDKEFREIAVFKIDDEAVNVEVIFEGETAWLTLDQIAALFGKSRSTVNEHILNIFREGELDEKVSVRKIGNPDYSGNVLSDVEKDFLGTISELNNGSKKWTR